MLKYIHGHIFCKYKYQNGFVSLFYTINQKLFNKVQTITDEKIIRAPVYNLPNNVIWNLRWLIPMALDQSLIFPILIEDRE